MEKWTTFKNGFALILVLLIFGMWLAERWLKTSETIQGATILALPIIIQFYFRKKGDSGTPQS